MILDSSLRSLVYVTSSQLILSYHIEKERGVYSFVNETARAERNLIQLWPLFFCKPPCTVRNYLSNQQIIATYFSSVAAFCTYLLCIIIRFDSRQIRMALPRGSVFTPRANARANLRVLRGGNTRAHGYRMKGNM